MSGQVDPLTTGMMYCELICAAQWLALHDRARDWTEVMDRWGRGGARSERSRDAVGCTGRSCSGSRDRARRPSKRRSVRARSCVRGCAASSAGRSWSSAASGCARVTWPAPRRSFAEAHEHAWSPQPGLALLRLAQGDVAAAAALIADAIEHPLDIPSKEQPPFADLRLAPCWTHRQRSRCVPGTPRRPPGRRRALAEIAAATPSPGLEPRRRGPGQARCSPPASSGRRSTPGQSGLGLGGPRGAVRDGSGPARSGPGLSCGRSRGPGPDGVDRGRRRVQRLRGGGPGIGGG